MANSNNVKSMATSSVAAESQSTAPAWQPGFRQTPWSAMVLIVIMLACMGASAGIIIGSNSQTVASWKIEPVVLLAVLSSIWNYSIGIVLGISVAITWWRTAHLLLDVATLALRLQKPLSARLFPVPGKDVGERTAFTSPYLTNTLVKEIS